LDKILFSLQCLVIALVAVTLSLGARGDRGEANPADLLRGQLAARLTDPKQCPSKDSVVPWVANKQVDLVFEFDLSAALLVSENDIECHRGDTIR
jgi:hypothetical protein